MEPPAEPRTRTSDGAGAGTRAMNAAERAYAEVRALIVNGQFPAGFRLREEELAEQIGVSRTPVREALRRLNAEGLVNLRPNHGAQVEQWSAAEMEDVVEIRALVQGHAARRAADRISPDDLAAIGELADRMIELAANGDRASLDEIAVLNRRFHDTVESAAGSPSLQAMLASLHAVPLEQGFFRYSSAATVERSLTGHLDLVEALRLGNGMWAEAIMRAHVLAGRSTRRRESGALEE
jgi:DNA-binding GntR family transcriptional regulator